MEPVKPDQNLPSNEPQIPPSPDLSAPPASTSWLGRQLNALRGAQIPKMKQEATTESGGQPANIEGLNQGVVNPVESQTPEIPVVPVAPTSFSAEEAVAPVVQPDSIETSSPTIAGGSGEAFEPITPVSAGPDQTQPVTTTVQSPAGEGATNPQIAVNGAEAQTQPLSPNSPVENVASVPVQPTAIGPQRGYEESQKEYVPGDSEKAAALDAVHQIVNDAKRQNEGAQFGNQPQAENLPGSNIADDRFQQINNLFGKGAIERANQGLAAGMKPGEGEGSIPAGDIEDRGILEHLATTKDYKEAYKLLEIVKGSPLNDALPVLTQFVSENHSEAGAITINHSVLVLRHVLSVQRGRNNDRLNLTPEQAKGIETFFAELSKSPLLEDPMVVSRVADEVKHLLDLNSEIVNQQRPFVERALAHESPEAISAGVKLIDSLPLDDALLVATKFAIENHSAAATIASPKAIGKLARFLLDRRQDPLGPLGLTEQEEQAFRRYLGALTDITVPAIQQLPPDDRGGAIRNFTDQVACCMIQNHELGDLGGKELMDKIEKLK